MRALNEPCPPGIALADMMAHQASTEVWVMILVTLLIVAVLSIIHNYTHFFMAHIWVITYSSCIPVIS